MGAYSFQDVYVSIQGPGLNAQLASGAAAAKEGVSVVFDEDKNSTTTGADGAIMHSLHAGMTGTITVRLLKTSPYNATLNGGFNFQRQSTANWGQNTLKVTDKVRGDQATGIQMAYVKHADNAFAEDGNVLEWQFRGVVREALAAGLPSLPNP